MQAYWPTAFQTEEVEAHVVMQALDAEINLITLCYSFELIELHYYCSFIVSVCRKSWDRYILFSQNLLQNLIEWSPESERYFSDLTLLGYQNESFVLRQKMV